ncbi:hypothetical protein [Flagellimonas iocasae]|uniref:Uncharacterized protein n=1 Tax=Flagellimonas iocasae TaxID=2055905 RepID=A0ABW4XXY6_9FLAO
MISCTDSSTTTRNYRILNDTDHTVELRFYKASTATSERSFVFKVVIEGEGLVLERTLKTYPPDTNGPTDVYEADSVAVVFNGERVEGHIFIEPISGSIMNLGDYERNGVQFTYTITEENYTNATPCDGSCN